MSSLETPSHLAPGAGFFSRGSYLPLQLHLLTLPYLAVSSSCPHRPWPRQPSLPATQPPLHTALSPLPFSPMKYHSALKLGLAISNSRKPPLTSPPLDGRQGCLLCVPHTGTAPCMSCPSDCVLAGLLPGGECTDARGHALVTFGFPLCTVLAHSRCIVLFRLF